MQIRRVFRRIPSVIQFVAGIATIILVVVPAWVILIDRGSGEDSTEPKFAQVTPTPTISTSPTDLTIAKITDCELTPVSDAGEDEFFDAGTVLLLRLRFDILNSGIWTYSQSDVAVHATSDLGLEGSVRKTVFDHSSSRWVGEETDIVMPLKPSDLDKYHIITVKVDSDGLDSAQGQFPESNEDNNESVTRLFIPAPFLNGDYESLHYQVRFCVPPEEAI